MKNNNRLYQYELSIVIVSYNTIQMTYECLESIYKFSKGVSIQIIVIDNNSNDGSAEMIKANFPDVILIQNDRNMGFAAANNQGFKCCQGKYVLLLNSDTLILDDALQQSIAFMERNPKVGAMGCKVLNPDLTIQATCSGYPTLIRLLVMTLGLDRISNVPIMDQYLLRSWKRDYEREVEVISGCYLMIRWEVIERVGFLDERFFFFAEETDWCRRIKEFGWRLVFYPKGEIIHYGGASIKKLNFKRDVMLTAATVNLHRKHGGTVHAVLAYLILMMFNISRATGFNAMAICKETYRDKADHFVNVVKSYQACWPRTKK